MSAGRLKVAPNAWALVSSSTAIRSEDKNPSQVTVLARVERLWRYPTSKVFASSRCQRSGTKAFSEASASGTIWEYSSRSAGKHHAMEIELSMIIPFLGGSATLFLRLKAVPPRSSA